MAACMIVSPCGDIVELAIQECQKKGWNKKTLVVITAFNAIETLLGNNGDNNLQGLKRDIQKSIEVGCKQIIVAIKNTIKCNQSYCDHIEKNILALKLKPQPSVHFLFLDKKNR